MAWPRCDINHFTHSELAGIQSYDYNSVSRKLGSIV